LEGLRQELLQPIAGFASQLLTAYCREQGYTVVVDISAPTTNVLYYNPANDITDAFVKRLDEEFAKAGPLPATAPATAAPPATAPPKKP